MLTKALAILAMCAQCCLAQPTGDPPPPPPDDHRIAERGEKAPPSTEDLRKRLLQTLQFAKRIVETHEAALAQLEEGEDPTIVMRELRAPQVRRAKRQTQDPNARPGIQESTQKTPPPMITDSDLDRVRAFIAQHLPEIDSKLKSVEQLSPDATKRLVHRLAPKVLEIEMLNAEDPTMGSLKLDELKAGLTYIDASNHYRGLLRAGVNDEERISNAEERVRKAASARFDAQVQIKQYEIHMLNKRIMQLHEALEELNAQRESQVEAQVQAARRTPGPRFDRPRNTNRDSED